jgi:uncharacterized membrane protein
MDTTKRSLAKTLSWRAVALISAFIISFLITGSAAAASAIAMVQMVFNTALYFIHERAWYRIKWGRKTLGSL